MLKEREREMIEDKEKEIQKDRGTMLIRVKKIRKERKKEIDRTNN